MGMSQTLAVSSALDASRASGSTDTFAKAGFSSPPPIGLLVQVVDCMLLVLLTVVVNDQASVAHAESTGGTHLVAGLVGLAVVSLSIRQSGGYRLAVLLDLTSQAQALVPRFIFASFAYAATLILLQVAVRPAFLWSAGWCVLGYGLLAGWRALLPVVLRQRMAAGDLARRIAVVGLGESSRRLVERVRDPAAGHDHIVGVFDVDSPSLLWHGGMPVLGSIEDLVVRSRQERVDAIVIALPAARSSELRGVCERLRSVTSTIYVLPDLADIASYLPLPPLHDLQQAIAVQRRPLEGWRAFQKMMFDRTASLVLLLAILPFLLLVAAAIKLDSPGPVLFRQPRLGFNNRPFMLFKFRSMYHHMADLSADRQTSRGDPRVTRVGRILRRFSVDELPQLINVLRGDMSLVGPRPHTPHTRAEGRLLEDAIGAYAERHRVLPGITGLAQVSGARGEIVTVDQIRERVRFDLEYIDNWTLLRDLKILFLTISREIVSSRAF